MTDHSKLASEATRMLLRVVSKADRSDDYMDVQLKYTVGGAVGSALVLREHAKKLKTGQLVDVERDADGELHVVDFTPSRRQKTASHPLRRVLGLVDALGKGVLHELYECGHTRAPKRDMYGRTNAEQRRCFRCGRDEAPDPRWKAEAERLLNERKA